MTDALFRREVATAGQTRLKGEVHVFNPLSWNVVFLALTTITAGLLIFAFAVPLARVVSLDATILPDRGIASLVAPRRGTLTGMRVAQGDHVLVGTVLATIDTDQTSAAGVSSERGTEITLRSQLREVDGQIASLRDKAANDDARSNGVRRSLVSAVASLQRQASLQDTLVRQAEKSLARAETLSAKGYVTTAYLDGLQESVLSKQQRAVEIRLALADKRQALADVPVEVQASRLAVGDSAAVLRARREGLRQQFLVNTLSGSYALRSTVAGIAGNIRFRVGETVHDGAAVIDIIPDGSRPVVALKVPSRSITRVRPGQPVRMSIDAMPSTTYGTLRGVVTSVASTTTSVVDGPRATEYYMAYCTIDVGGTPPRIVQSLRANMTGSAAVVTERLTIANWFFQSFAGRAD